MPQKTNNLSAIRGDSKIEKEFHMSRKMSIMVGVVAILVLAFAGLAYAQTPAATEEATAPAAASVPETEAVTETVTTTLPVQTGCPYGNYVDDDGDGVCDYREDGGANQQWGPRAGMGRMGGMMQGGMMYGGAMRGGMMHWGHHYTDADGDGICDNCEDSDGSPDSSQYRYGRGMGEQGMNGPGMMGRGMNRGWHR
jgi:hypothetical protein